MASSVIISGDQAGSKTIFGWTAETPGRSPTNSLHLLGDLGADRAGGGGQGEGDVDVLFLDRDVVDEAERDEVEAELGVDDLLERLVDVLLGRDFRVGGRGVGLSAVGGLGAGRRGRASSSRAVCCSWSAMTRWYPGQAFGPGGSGGAGSPSPSGCSDSCQ